MGDWPLTARPASRDFAGALPVPPAETIRQAQGSSLQMATVEVLASDGDQTVARASLDVQILDDSEEFRDPRPDPDRLIKLAEMTGGKVLKYSADLARILDQPGKTADRVVTSRLPVWDQSWVLSLLLMLLAAEWVARRIKGLA